MSVDLEANSLIRDVCLETRTESWSTMRLRSRISVRLVNQTVVGRFRPLTACVQAFYLVRRLAFIVRLSIVSCRPRTDRFKGTKVMLDQCHLQPHVQTTKRTNVQFLVYPELLWTIIVLLLNLHQTLQHPLILTC